MITSPRWAGSKPPYNPFIHMTTFFLRRLSLYLEKGQIYPFLLGSFRFPSLPIKILLIPQHSAFLRGPYRKATSGQMGSPLLRLSQWAAETSASEHGPVLSCALRKHPCGPDPKLVLLVSLSHYSLFPWWRMAVVTTGAVWVHIGAVDVY